MKKECAEISKVYYDERNSNKTRPWCTKVAILAVGRRHPKYAVVMVVRSPTEEGARIIRTFLIKERRRQRTIPNYLAVINAIMEGTLELGQRIAAERYAAELANA